MSKKKKKEIVEWAGHDGDKRVTKWRRNRHQAWVETERVARNLKKPLQLCWRKPLSHLIQKQENASLLSANAGGALAFNAHLDKCAQCKNHPFSLCDEGSKLLHEATGTENVERFLEKQAKL